MIFREFHHHSAQALDRLIRGIVSGPIDPDAPFLIAGESSGQVYSLAESIRTAIDDQGHPHQPLCVCTFNRAHVAAAMIAALSGGPMLLLPFAHTLETLEDARCKMPYRFALVDEHRPLPAGIVPLVVQNLTGTAMPRQVPECRAPDSPWLYLFTGGTTGTPQLWSKTPKNLLSEVSYLAASFQITARDKILATVPVNHIYGLLYSLLLPLITGAAVSPHTPSYPKEMAHALADTKATVFISIPAHYRALKECPVGHHHLRMALSSAGALSEEDDRAFFSTTGIAVTEIYGSTETGGIAYRKRAAAQSLLTPFSCVDVKMEKDQLWVRSDFLSAELPKNENGFYQTSDRAAPDGTSGFRLLGRSDGIVKVGGKRVDLMQLQELLKREPGVRDAYVFSLPVNSGRENEILALIEGEIEEESLRKSALQRLEPHAHPRQMRIVEKIPLSPSGKYDRTAIENAFKKRTGKKSRFRNPGA